MGILKEKLFGSVDLGVYMAINDKFMIVPTNAPKEKSRAFEKPFSNSPDFSIINTTINQSSLLGVYLATNSNGILVPSIITDPELEILQEISTLHNMKLTVLKCKDNALGNLILCNNKGCIISSELSENIKKIQEILDVEVMILDYAKNRLPGSCGIANNRGCCVHPLTSEEEAELIGDILQVPVDVSTINMGNPYIRAGALVNDHGGIFGYDSSGPELMRISNVLDL